MPSSLPASQRDARFSALLEMHANTVNRYLTNRHRAGDALDTEDLLAEVFAIAWRRLDDVPVDAEAAWLIGVARNRVLNMRTKQHRRLRRAHMLGQPTGTAPAAEDEVVAELALRSAIATLSETEREVFLLSAWEQLAPREISVVLGISENAARIRLSRARSHLLALLAIEGPETDRLLAKDKE